jgi:hypothetical protein
MKLNKWFFIGFIAIFFSIFSILTSSNYENFSGNAQTLFGMLSLTMFIVILYCFKSLTSLKGRLHLISGISLFVYIFFLLLGNTTEVIMEHYELEKSVEDQVVIDLHYSSIFSHFFLAIFFVISSFAKEVYLKAFALIAAILTVLFIFLEFANTYKVILSVKGWDVFGGFFTYEPFLKDIYGILFSMNMIFLGTIFLRSGLSLPKIKSKSAKKK